jgi:transposase
VSSAQSFPTKVLRGIALGRKSWLFAGSDRGGERAALMLTLIHSAKLNDVDSQGRRDR